MVVALGGRVRAHAAGVLTCTDTVGTSGGHTVTTFGTGTPPWAFALTQAGAPVSRYVGGQTYTLTISGTTPFGGFIVRCEPAELTEGTGCGTATPPPPLPAPLQRLQGHADVRRLALHRGGEGGRDVAHRRARATDAAAGLPKRRHPHVCVAAPSTRGVPARQPRAASRAHPRTRARPHSPAPFAASDLKSLVSLGWTAPVPGTGNVTFFGIIVVDNNNLPFRVRRFAGEPCRPQ